MQLLPTAIILESSQADLDFQSLLQFYQDDLLSLVSFNAVFDLWKHTWLSEPRAQLASEHDTPRKTLAHSDGDFFPNICVLLIIMATLPVTSCEYERSISMLKLLKTPLRSTMGQDRLNGLAMLFYNCHVDITAEVVEEFSHRHSRCMLLANPFIG